MIQAEDHKRFGVVDVTTGTSRAEKSEPRKSSRFEEAVLVRGCVRDGACSDSDKDGE